MIIGIDGNEANIKKRVGSNIYAFEIIRALYELDRKNSYQIYLKNRILEDFPKESWRWHYKKIIPAMLSTQVGLPIQLFFGKPRPDVFFTPGHYAPRYSPIPTVISILDVSYLLFPEYFKKSDLTQLTSWSSYSIKNARKILTISEATKKDIVKYYSVSPNKIVVTYPGFTPFEKTKKIDISGKYKLAKRYCLFVGTLQPRKNLIRLLEAVNRLEDKIMQLVIVGKKGWLFEDIFHKVKELNLENRVLFLDYVSRNDLYFLLKNAQCLILPSLYEGFGIPILEAMAAGTLVVASDVSSLPEIVGEGGFFVNPYDTQSIQKGLEKALNLDSNERNRIIQKGQERVKLFSWEKCASLTLAVLEEVYHEDNY